MTTTINASTSAGLVQTADTSGALDFQTNGTTALGFDSSGVLSFNSGYGSAAKAYGCRAWVNFNGTGTVAIRASGNVTSITDNGVGDYTVNMTTAMPDTNYEANYSCQEDGAGFGTFINEKFSGTRTTTALPIVLIKYNLSARVDSAVVNVAIFR